MKELTLEELTKTRYTTELSYGGNCCVEGIEDTEILNVRKLRFDVY